MGHFFSMILFAFFVALVFSLLNKDSLQDRLRYFAKLFAAFVGLSILAAWIMYPFPF